MVNNLNRRNRRKNSLRNMSNRVRKMSRRVRNMGRRIGRKNRKSTQKVRNLVKRSSRKMNTRRRNRRNRRNMRGGAIEYSPLPCDANGNTQWDSTSQVGHETCVEYGTQGAENDARAAGLGAGNLSSMNITQTIQDAVDQQLRQLATNMVGLPSGQVRQALQGLASGAGSSSGNTAAVQGAMDPEASRQAYQLAQDRISQQAYQDSLASGGE